MKFTELKESLEKSPKTIYFLDGDDAYFKTKSEEMIKKRFLQMPELNFSMFDGQQLKGAKLSELTSAIENYPFMSEKRIVKVVDFFPTETDYEKYLKKTFENMPESTILIIANQLEKKCDLKKKKCITVIDCSRSDEETVTKWVYLTLKKAGIVISVDAANAVAQYCLCNMARVSVEVQKLIDYKGQGNISREEIDELVYQDAEYRIYEMTNAIARGNSGQFITIAHDLLEKGFDEIALLNQIFSYFKTLLSCLTIKGNDAEVAGKLKSKEYAVKKNREQARLLGEERINQMLLCVYENISKIKSGLCTQESALDAVIQKIFFYKSK